MHVDHQRFAGHVLRVYAGGICEPVVRVYHVAWNGARDHSGHNRVIVDFLDDVVWVSAGEFDASQVIETHIVEIGVDMVAKVEIQLRVHHLAYASLHIIAVHVAPCHRSAVGADDVGESLLLVSPVVWG